MSKRIPPNMRRVVKTEKGWTIFVRPMFSDDRKGTHQYSATRPLIEQIALDAIRQHMELTISIHWTARVWSEDEALP